MLHLPFDKKYSFYAMFMLKECIWGLYMSSEPSFINIWWFF